LSEPEEPVEDHDIARILANEEPSFDDIKTLMRGVRYIDGHDDRFEYANTLLPEASSYLRSHTLRALVRSDITEEEAAKHLEQNKAFFGRLVNLLPSIMRFFSKEARLRNPQGIVMSIDDCHNDFLAAGNALRRDRQVREAKEKLTRASRLAIESASALSDAEGHFEIEFDRYRAVYYRPVPGPGRFLGDLIDELRMCAGVLDIVHEIADIKPKHLFVFGNDQRTDLVESVYHMCTMWDGPKLVTTPGSDFSALCSLMFEAASGNSSEGLAGAINRFARSDDRRQWDLEGEEDEADDDNFETEKQRMGYSSKQIELCKRLLQKAGLSEMAISLLNARIKHEEKEYEKARRTYGPRQVYASQMNEDQTRDMLMEAVNRLKPEQIDRLDDMIMRRKSLSMRDVEYGQEVRAKREGKIDAKSGNLGK
jgi:hypothetical protein